MTPLPLHAPFPTTPSSSPSESTRDWPDQGIFPGWQLYQAMLSTVIFDSYSRSNIILLQPTHPNPPLGFSPAYVLG